MNILKFGDLGILWIFGILRPGAWDPGRLASWYPGFLVSGQLFCHRPGYQATRIPGDHERGILVAWYPGRLVCGRRVPQEPGYQDARRPGARDPGRLGFLF